MSSFRFDPYTQPPKTMQEAEQQRLYFSLLVRSLEAKFTRIEPLSVEFEDTISMLYRARTALECVANKLMCLRYEEMTKNA